MNMADARSMSARERRERLFRKTRPLVRRLEMLDGETYSRDAGVLWAAYKAGSFVDLPADLTAEQFGETLENLQKTFDQVWVIDDFNPAYKDRRGPVALACTKSFDLVVNAEGVAFKWASKRNVLRCAASFLNMLKHSKKTGICMVKGAKPQVPMLKHLAKYDLLYYVGKPSEGEWLFSIRGRGSD